jgi:8-oxo-dGTP pyrophosphatase MutT (NUDIX family)
MNSRWKPNVTVAAIIEQDGKFMLVEEETSNGLMLNNPAGHLDAGEAPVAACIREVLEETTYGFTPTHLVGVYMSRTRRVRTGQDTTYLRFAFCGVLGDVQPGAELDTGIVRTLWMTAEEIRDSVARHRTPLLLRCVEDYLAGQRLPLNAIFTDSSIYSYTI